MEGINPGGFLIVLLGVGALVAPYSLPGWWNKPYMNPWAARTMGAVGVVVGIIVIFNP